jgi:hypothetical protein
MQKMGVIGPMFDYGGKESLSGGLGPWQRCVGFIV